MATSRIQRSVSMPVRPPANAASSPSPDAGIEVLFDIPTEVRIISFTATRTQAVQKSSLASASYGSSGDDDRLLWTSRFERTIAIGPLRIYRAPGSVAFLKCASALRPIMLKSKCWALNEEGTTFILQVNPPQYWRIEVLPAGGKEHEYGMALKDVFAQVLMFDKTPCPFHRSFTIELPSPPMTPVKKRPWKPVERTPSSVATSRAATPTIESRPTSPDRKSSRGKSDEERTSQGEAHGRQECKAFGVSDSSAPSTPLAESVPVAIAKKRRNTKQDLEDVPSFEVADGTTSAAPSIPPADAEASEPSMLKQCNRTVTAPPLLSLVISPPSKRHGIGSNRSPRRVPKPHSARPISPSRTPHRHTSDATSSPCVSSTESFHSTLSWHSPLTPGLPAEDALDLQSAPGSFPYPHDNIILPPQHERSRQTSEMTLTPVTQVPPRTPPSLADSDAHTASDHDEIATPPSPRSRLRHRHHASPSRSRQALPSRSSSPLATASEVAPRPKTNRSLISTSATNVSSTHTSRESDGRLKKSKPKYAPRRLPILIIQKTCEILLSPPSHLLHLMLSIAARIAAGEWKGVLLGRADGEAVHWDLERDEFIDEDDYGISLGQYATAASASAAEPEADDPLDTPGSKATTTALPTKVDGDADAVDIRFRRPGERMSGSWDVD